MAEYNRRTAQNKKTAAQAKAPKIPKQYNNPLKYPTIKQEEPTSTHEKNAIRASAQVTTTTTTLTSHTMPLEKNSCMNKQQPF